MRCTFLNLLLLFVLFSVVSLSAEEFSLTKNEKGYEVKIDGKSYAGYIVDFQGTPIIWPIIGPTGKKMTRDFPMIERQDNTEAKDHPHHRSIWFNHGEVGKNNYWHIPENLEQRKGDKIVHQNFLKAECDGKTATIVTENDWLDNDGQALCSDVRTIRFGTFQSKNGPIRYIDFDVTVTAKQDSIVFGDTKEGTFGIRVPGTMDLTAKKRNKDWGGHIVNAQGDQDEKTWAKRSDWVDYYGPVEGEILGIAVLNHPSSFRYPTYWHVRDYGLFAANPFGVHDFENKKEKIGEYEMNKGDSFTLRYRILFHAGDADQADIANAFKQYAEMKFD